MIQLAALTIGSTGDYQKKKLTKIVDEIGDLICGSTDIKRKKKVNNTSHRINF